MSGSAKPALAPALVGAFVLGGVALAVAAVILFGNLNILNPPTQAVVIFQGSVDGLDVGAPVTFRGVHVGSVAQIVIEFDRTNRIAYIPVTLALQADHVLILQTGAPTKVGLEQIIARGLRAELNTESIVTGQAEIELDIDPTSPAVLHPGLSKYPEIPTRESPMDRLKNVLTHLPLRELTDNATATLKSLRSVSDKLDHQLPSLIASVQATSDHASAAIDSLVASVRDVQAKLDTTLAAITTAAGTGNKVLTQRSADLRTLLVTANQAMIQAKGVLADVHSLTGDRAAARTNLESTLRDLSAAAAGLRGLATDVEANPQLLLTGRRP